MKQRVFQKILFLLVCSFFTTLFLQAQTYRDWVGGATGNWTDAANWSGSNVPDAATEYARFTNTSAVNVTMPATLTVGGILAEGTANLTLSGTSTVTLSGTAGGTIFPKTISSSITLGANGTFTVVDTGYVSVAASGINFAGTGGTVNIQGRFLVGSTAGLNGGVSTSISSTNSPTVILGANSDVFYNSTMTQTITPRLDYNTISFGNAGTKTLSGNLISALKFDARTTASPKSSRIITTRPPFADAAPRLNPPNTPTPTHAPNKAKPIAMCFARLTSTAQFTNTAIKPLKST
jgi:hypothetical protein